MFSGAMTALVTPMRDGQIDEAALEALVEWQIGEGIDALVPCGTTGESATLTHEEHGKVIRRVVKAARKRVPVIAGAGSNSTAEAVALSKDAKEAGADALLQITPYYNRPTQEGLYLHFRAIAEAVPLPLVLYNVPARTGCDLLPETIARLAELPSVVAVKEAHGTVQRTQQIIARTGDRLAILSGEDAINYPLYAVGARGCISVVSNVAPRLVAEGWDAHAAGDSARARKLHYDALPLAEALFSEASPIPAKTALGLMGKMSPELRLPHHPMSEAPKQKLRAVMQQLGLVK
ncbi:MAG TPA: 4-hydroxy-tetrahydrodipicolinate synthase [Polyangia bacterium]|nr:4-hydroxy-tetrahydrodipicolinate synthase [Polyangia bacterium]